LLSSKQNDLHAGAESYIFCCSLQRIEIFYFFWRQGWKLKWGSHGSLLSLTFYLISESFV